MEKWRRNLILDFALTKVKANNMSLKQSEMMFDNCQKITQINIFENVLKLRCKYNRIII